MKYKNTPKEIFRIIALFYESRLSYNLFKCEHIFEGANKNLDILFETHLDYDAASQLLELEGYVLYMSEKIEKYKRMYTLFRNGVVTRIHLHREVAWHGLVVLDKKDIFLRAEKLSSVIFVPSNEDQLLIHTAHILFENFVISNHVRGLINGLLQDVDFKYVNSILNKSWWKDSFYYIIRLVKENKQPRMNKVVGALLKKAIVTPSSWVPLIKKSFAIVFRLIDFRRKGVLIALVGVNGTGKTTLVSNTLDAYQPLSRTVNGQFGYYFGWKPFLPVTKVISRRLKMKKKKIFYKLNKSQRFSLFQELFFIYNYVEYLFRYLFVVWPQLRKRRLVACDRYIYGLYGQYTHAPKSVVLWLLLYLYPQPDFLFVLDADLDILLKRGKEGEERVVKDSGDLEGQRKRYSYLRKKLGGVKLDTSRPLKESVDFIINATWRTFIRGNQHKIYNVQTEKSAK